MSANPAGCSTPTTCAAVGCCVHNLLLLLPQAIPLLLTHCCLSAAWSPLSLHPTVLEQVGWVSPGEVVGEAALFTPTAKRLTSVLAGEDGVHVAELDRATYNRLAAAADTQVGGFWWLLMLWCCCWWCRELSATVKVSGSR
jgi:hypothetical protein